MSFHRAAMVSVKARLLAVDQLILLCLIRTRAPSSSDHIPLSRSVHDAVFVRHKCAVEMPTMLRRSGPLQTCHRHVVLTPQEVSADGGDS